MIVPRLGIEGGFRVLMRLVGRPEDFRDAHVISLTLTGPDTDTLRNARISGRAARPSSDSPTRRRDQPSSSSRCEDSARCGGRLDLALALDGERDQRHTIAITAVTGQ